MPSGDWAEARDSDETWVMRVKPPGSGEHDRPPASGPGLSQRRRSGPMVGLTVVVVAALIAGAAEFGAIEDHFARPEFVPAVVSASAADSAHPAENLTDHWNNTWWGSGTASPGTTLDVTFGHPENLVDVAVTPGAGTTAGEFRSEDSPSAMTMTLTGQNGVRSTQTLRFPDAPGPRVFPVHGDGITRVHFTVTGLRRGGAPDSEAAIADIEFFSR